MDLLNSDMIREKRAAKGLTQAGAAAIAKLPGGGARWSNIEKGDRTNITLDTLARIAIALGCDPAELLLRPKRKK